MLFLFAELVLSSPKVVPFEFSITNNATHNIEEEKTLFVASLYDKNANFTGRVYDKVNKTDKSLINLEVFTPKNLTEKILYTPSYYPTISYNATESTLYRGGIIYDYPKDCKDSTYVHFSYKNLTLSSKDSKQIEPKGEFCIVVSVPSNVSMTVEHVQLDSDDECKAYAPNGYKSKKSDKSVYTNNLFVKCKTSKSKDKRVISVVFSDKEGAIAPTKEFSKWVDLDDYYLGISSLTALAIALIIIACIVVVVVVVLIILCCCGCIACCACCGKNDNRNSTDEPINP